MIIGIGIDLVDSQRIEKLIEKHPTRFIEKHFTQSEQEQAKDREKAGAVSLFYAKRFAAKEALVKALGTGFTEGISFQDIDIYNDAKGCPHIRISGNAEKVLMNLIPQGKKHKIHLSLSDEPPMVIAQVTVEAI